MPDTHSLGPEKFDAQALRDWEDEGGAQSPDTVTTPLLLKTVISGKLQPEQLITHHFTLKDVMKAYDTFADATNQRALKVIITNALDIM